MKARSMTDDCRKLGIAPENVFTQIPNTILWQKRHEQRQKRITPQGFLETLDVALCYHCNLNCAGCNVFSPLASEPMFADVDVFENDVKRLSCLFGGKLGNINLFGGEPLLHPEITKFIRVARKHFPQTVIKIITNGILLERMPAEFWDACAEQEVVISATPYPLKIDFDKIKELVEEKGIEFEFFGIATEKTSWNIALDPKGRQAPYQSFIDCMWANRCYRLKDGKLTTCSPILSIDFFNKHFNTDLQVCPDDYIDIYKAQSGSEIMDFLARPIPFCRYCDVKKRTFDNPWHISERALGEWVIDDR
jgi:organic radical activating enzyme